MDPVGILDLLDGLGVNIDCQLDITGNQGVHACNRVCDGGNFQGIEIRRFSPVIFVAYADGFHSGLKQLHHKWTGPVAVPGGSVLDDLRLKDAQQCRQVRIG